MISSYGGGKDWLEEDSVLVNSESYVGGGIPWFEGDNSLSLSESVSMEVSLY